MTSLTLRPGDEVFVFTASGTFRGQKGIVQRTARGGALIDVEGEHTPLLFTDREIVPVEDGQNVVAGE